MPRRKKGKPQPMSQRSKRSHARAIPRRGRSREPREVPPHAQVETPAGPELEQPVAERAETHEATPARHVTPRPIETRRLEEDC